MMVKRLIQLSFCLFGLLGVVLMPAGAEASAEKLTFSIFFPPTHAQAKMAIDFAKEIEMRTQNRVEITCFPGGTLTGASQVYDGVVNGISDLGNSCFAYTRGRFPVMAVVDLPLGYLNGLVASRVADTFAMETRPEELDDVKVLYVHAHGPGLLHTRKPVQTLEDLKGMKIRATGLSAKIVEALGAVPVAMPQGGTYEALQKGVVEGTFGPIEVLKGWKQGEVIQYTTECFNVGYTTAMFVVMNLQKWNALPDDIKKIIDAASREWVDVHGRAWDDADREGREYTLGLGNKIIPLSPEESSKWRAAVKPVIDDYIETTPDGQTHVDRIQGILNKYQP